MAMEEEKLFPLADRLLDQSSWAKVEAQDPAQKDPLFSERVDAGYARLYARIVSVITVFGTEVWLN